MRGNFENVLATHDDGTDFYDQLEPIEEAENDYREAPRRALAFVFTIIELLSAHSNERQLKIKFLAVASALQHPCVADWNDSELAQELAMTRANFSKHVLNFELRNSLPPTLGQKPIQACRSYAKSHGPGDKMRASVRGHALSALATALGHLEKLSETMPASDWPEVEQDLLNQRVGWLQELAAS